jgi:hypothetical protein
MLTPQTQFRISDEHDAIVSDLQALGEMGFPGLVEGFRKASEGIWLALDHGFTDKPWTDGSMSQTETSARDFANGARDVAQGCANVAQQLESLRGPSTEARALATQIEGNVRAYVTTAWGYAQAAVVLLEARAQTETNGGDLAQVAQDTLAELSVTEYGTPDGTPEGTSWQRGESSGGGSGEVTIGTHRGGPGEGSTGDATGVETGGGETGGGEAGGMGEVRGGEGR